MENKYGINLHNGCAQTNHSEILTRAWWPHNKLLFPSSQLTEHGVELLRVEVPLAPGRLVTLGLGVVGVVELGLRPK